jgi:WD40 repeat protein
MSVLETKCRNCGVLLSFGAIEGYCRRCLAGVAFAGEDSGVSIERRLGAHELLEVIGEGGMGIVYRARQAGLQREVAIKVLRQGPFARPDEVLRFRREAAAAATLRHPNIVAVFEEGEVDGHAYFSMELVRGQSLGQLTRDGPIEPARAARYALAIAKGIAAAHANGVLHRDLKPANVIIDPDDEPRITDFGLAKRLDEDDPTVTQGIIGSPGYMSPEQVESERGAIGPASDVYSMGAMLYHLLTGRPPFAGASVASTLAQVLNNEPVPPRQLNPAMSPDLETICLKCLRKEPTDRYGSAAALAEDLERHRLGEPIHARPVGATERLWRWCRRQPLIASLSGGILLLMLVVAVGSTVAAVRISAARNSAQDERRRAVEAGRQLSESNEKMTDTVRILELQRAEDLLEAGNTATAIAQLVDSLRRDPSNHVAASRLVSALMHRNLALLAVPPLRHGGEVTSFDLRSDGIGLVTGGTDGSARLWSVQTGQALGPTMESESPMTRVKFSRDGQPFATGHKDGTIRLWSGPAAQPLATLTGHHDSIEDLDFAADGQWLASASKDRTFRLWRLPTGEPIHTLSGSRSGAAIVVFSPDGKAVFGGSAAGGGRAWDTRTGASIWWCPAHGQSISSARFSKDGSRLLTASHDGNARIWDAATGQPASGLLPHNSRVHAAEFSPDGRSIATGCQDGTVWLWSARDGRTLRPPFKHGGAVRAVAFSEDGQHLATASLDVTARIWNVKSGEMYCQPMWHGEAVRDVRFGIGTPRLMTMSSDALIRIWDVRPRVYQPKTFSHPGGILVMNISQDGKTLFTGSTDRTARLWDVLSGEQAGDSLEHQGHVTAVAFSPDGRFAATAARTKFQVWDLKTRAALLMNPPVEESIVRWIEFSPDGRRFVTCSSAGSAQVWKATTGEPSGPALLHAKDVWFVRFSPDGRRIATASLDHTARIWDAETGRPMTPPMSHIDDVKRVDFSPDGRWLVTASSDNFAAIWNASSGKLHATMRHARSVNTASFSPDGRRIVTASIDRTARIWDAATGRALTAPIQHHDYVNDARFSPDGTRIATICADGSARLWDVKTGLPLTEPLRLRSRENLLFMQFTPDGRRLAVAGKSGVGAIWDLPGTPVPVPTWFTGFTETISALRINSQGETELVQGRGIDELIESLKSHSTGDFYSRLARWLISDPESRPDSPFSYDDLDTGSASGTTDDQR